jgi:threonyl-tRNA synthetase
MTMSDTIQIRLPDGSERSLPAGATPFDLATSIGPGLAKNALGALIDDQLWDLRKPLPNGALVTIVTEKNPRAIEILRHTTAHVLAEAVQKLYPGTQVTIGPVIDDGFYYDFARDGGFTPDDLVKIEAEMAKIIADNRPITCAVYDRPAADKFFADLGETFKREILADIPGDEPITLYSQGGWTDLCRGPHLPSTGWIKSFKLMKTSGAYWRGDEKNPMLARVYGTAFFSKKDLEDHLHRLAEAERRDHRKLGTALDLFSIVDEVGGGLVLWHPRGAMVRHQMETFWREKHLANGYNLVYSPHIGRSTLWQTSGHLDFYKDGMFAAMEVEGQDYYVKPMNCPFHMNIFRSRTRSYRELPLRLAELGTVYRFERSGTLHGLMRVRGFTQDDSHIFCTPEQMEAEVVSILGFCMAILRTFGFEHFEAYIATRPEKAVGDPAKWEAATQALKIAAEKAGLEPKWDIGGGAFYGPKIDIKLRDALNREWQCSTIQFDFNLPERFELSYVGEDNQPHQPYVVHRALLGSVERFFGVLTEHYAGDFPMWLAPEQIRILPIADRHNGYAQQLAEKLRGHGLRATVDERIEKVNRKIRDAEVLKVPFMLIVGDKDIEAGGASVRARLAKPAGSTAEGEVPPDHDLGFKPLAEVVDLLTKAAAIPYVPPTPRA